LLSRIQGVEPQWMHVVLGGAATPEQFQVQRYMAYFRRVRSEFEKAWKLETDTYPEPTEHCEVCSWFPLCDTRRRADDHPSLVALPTPSSADVFLDFEANPYVLDQGLEYLIGMVTLPANSGGDPIYESLWSSSRSDEKKAFETFIARVMERWRRNPEMHIYHY